MEQPAAAYTDADLTRILARDYPEESRAEAMAVLDLYGNEPWHRESLRVRMACLKLAAGNLTELRKFVRYAGYDWRDVLAPAEYPRYPTFGDAAQREQAIAADWADLQAWLHRE